MAYGLKACSCHPLIKITAVHQVRMSSASTAVWAWRYNRKMPHGSWRSWTHWFCAMDCFCVSGWQKPKDLQFESRGWERHFTRQYKRCGIHHAGYCAVPDFCTISIMSFWICTCWSFENDNQIQWYEHIELHHSMLYAAGWKLQIFLVIFLKILCNSSNFCVYSILKTYRIFSRKEKSKLWNVKNAHLEIHPSTVL